MMFGGLGADEQAHGKAAAETPIRSQSRRLRGGEDACIASIIVTADTEPATRPDEEDPVSLDQHEAPDLLLAGFAGKHNIRDAGTLAQLTALATGLVGKRLIYCDLIADGGVASGTRARTLLVRAHGAEECMIQARSAYKARDGPRHDPSGGFRPVIAHRPPGGRDGSQASGNAPQAIGESWSLPFTPSIWYE